MEIITRINERMEKHDYKIKSLVLFFNNFIERNFKKFALNIGQNDLKYLIYFLELNLKLLSTNKVKYLLTTDHSQIASESDKEFKANLIKFIIFLIFLINIHNKNFNYHSILNKYDNIQIYVSLGRKFYLENLIDSDSYIRFLKIIASLSLFSFDNNIWNITNTQYLNNLYKKSKNLKKLTINTRVEMNKGSYINLYLSFYSIFKLDISSMPFMENVQNKKVSNGGLIIINNNHDSGTLSQKEDKIITSEGNNFFHLFNNLF